MTSACSCVGANTAHNTHREIMNREKAGRWEECCLKIHEITGKFHAFHIICIFICLLVSYIDVLLARMSAPHV